MTRVGRDLDGNIHHQVRGVLNGLGRDTKQKNKVGVISFVRAERIYHVIVWLIANIG